MTQSKFENLFYVTKNLKKISERFLTKAKKRPKTAKMAFIGTNERFYIKRGKN